MSVPEQTSKAHYLEPVRRPDRNAVNSGMTCPREHDLVALFGQPSDEKPTAGAAKLRRGFATRMKLSGDDLPFRVFGLAPAVDSLVRVFKALRERRPILYPYVGTAGMFNPRLVAGTDSWSSHAFGTAIDIKLYGLIDQPGDDLVQQGLLYIYPHFRAEGWYWGAAFPKEDGMHFEVSLEKLRQWKDQGAF